MTARRFLNMPRGQAWRITADPEPWQNRAGCAGDPSHSWFTHPYQLPYRERDRLALACRWCPVIVQCLEAALDGGDCGTTRAGIWFRHPSQLHGRTQVEPWCELWLDEQRLPSELWRTIRDEDRE